MIDEDAKTLWCGNLADQVSEVILYELFLQAGPLEKVRIARDRDGRQKNFAFITYCHEVSVPYAIQLFRGTALFHKALSLQSRGRSATMPPPIRCTTLDPAFGLQSEIQIDQQVSSPRQYNDPHDKLTMASLQGNWSHRQHPYRNEDRRGYRDDHKERNGERQRDNNSWRNRDRRNRDQGSRRNRNQRYVYDSIYDEK